MISRVAIYARFSSETQSEASIEDQVRICRAHAEKEGWSVVAVHEDRALSGASMLRPGYQALRNGIQAGHYDIVLAESLDRFARDLEFAAALHKLTEYAGVGLRTIADGLISPMHVAIKGFLSSAQLADLGAKTRRGIEGRILAGRCSGPPPYGYARVAHVAANGELDRGLRTIVTFEAEIVRRIFESYAAGASPRRIARQLNEEGVVAPGGGAWSDTAIRGRDSRGDGILRNAFYTGKIVWGRRQNVRDPMSGERRRRLGKSDNRAVGYVPELRVIDEALWSKVQSKLTENASGTPHGGHVAPGFWNRRRPRHLLSGKVICGACGGAFSNVGKDYLACLKAKHNSCVNTRRIRRHHLEDHVLQLVRRQLMAPDLLAAFQTEFSARWLEVCAAHCGKSAAAAKDRAALDRQIARLVDALAEGGAARPLTAKLADLERRRHLLCHDADGPDPVPGRLDQISWETYAAEMDRLTARIRTGDDPESLDIARRLIDQIVVYPDPTGPNSGLDLIGDLIALLHVAGLPKSGSSARVESALATLLCSVKGGPGAEPLAFLHPEPTLLYPVLALLSAALVALMIRVGALDHPVERSSHTQPTPKGGGVGIVAAYVAGMIWLMQTGRADAETLVIVPAALFLAVISYLDDVRNWPFTAKLAAQLAAAVMCVVFGGGLLAWVFEPLQTMASDRWVAPLLAIVWLLYVTNAVNFIDGLNGLASGSVAVAALALCWRTTGAVRSEALVLVAGIAGFLPFNYPRARIFMGDVGSQVCGFLIAGLALQVVRAPAINLIIPLALLPIVADVAFTLLRRARNGAHLAQAHRGHLYQVANRAGMAAWQVTLIYWAMAAWGGGLGIVAGAAGGEEMIQLLASAAAALPVGVWALFVARTAKRAGLTVW